MLFTERDLVRLVIQLHPYSIPPTMTFAPPPNISAWNAAIVAAATTPTTAAAILDATVTPVYTGYEFETQDNPGYQMDWRWEFKGQERIIRRALRFKYQYPIYNGGGALATDYMLVGYEGGGGP